MVFTPLWLGRAQHLLARGVQGQHRQVARPGAPCVVPRLGAPRMAGGDPPEERRALGLCQGSGNHTISSSAFFNLSLDARCTRGVLI